MPIYKGKEISMDEWYKINPAGKAKHPMTPEEVAAKRKKEHQESLIDSVNEFGDALEIGDYIYAANDKSEGIKTGEASRVVVDAYRMLAQLILKRHNLPADTGYNGSADEMYMEEETCDNSINIPGASDDPTLC